jgi:hypothetical protein
MLDNGRFDGRNVANSYLIMNWSDFISKINIIGILVKWGVQSSLSLLLFINLNSKSLNTTSALNRVLSASTCFIAFFSFWRTFLIFLCGSRALKARWKIVCPRICSQIKSLFIVIALFVFPFEICLCDYSWRTLYDVSVISPWT